MNLPKVLALLRHNDAWYDHLLYLSPTLIFSFCGDSAPYIYTGGTLGSDVIEYLPGILPIFFKAVWKHIFRSALVMGTAENGLAKNNSWIVVLQRTICCSCGCVCDCEVCVLRECSCLNWVALMARYFEYSYLCTG